MWPPSRSLPRTSTTHAVEHLRGAATDTPVGLVELLLRSHDVSSGSGGR